MPAVARTGGPTAPLVVSVPVPAVISTAAVITSLVSVSAVSPTSSLGPAPASCGSAHVHAGGGGVRPLSDGEVHPDLLTVQLSPVHFSLSISSIMFALVVDESKAPAPARVTVQYDLHLLHVTELSKLFVQLSLGGVEAEAKDSDTLAGGRVLSVPNMTSAIGHRAPGVAPP